jgi:hypothetical protein
MRLRLEYSTNAGSTWIPIDTNVYAVNLPSTNLYNWVIPNAPTTQALVRVKVAGGTISDASDAVFTITPQPSVVLTSPAGGVPLYVGDVKPITWNWVNTQYVKLDYSTDGGTSWLDVVPNGQTIPAYVGTFAWTVPNTPSNNALVRVTNVERPRFRDSTRPATSILLATVKVNAPNGGEKYELNQPVTVTWSSQNSQKLRLDYSGDNGNTWTTAATNIDGTLGTYTFTPVAIPTKIAFVRLVNVDRTNIQDVSDASFEIMQAKSISVYTPAAGDRVLKSSSTTITWDAPRVANVSISYSLNGGGTWQTIVGNVPASQGTYPWNVPGTTTTQAKIRVQEVGGSTIGESDIFSIVDQAQPSVRIVVPNGGEQYTAGDTVHVRWTATAVTTVAVSYSSDGSTWNVIKSGVAAGLGQLLWSTAGMTPGTNYRVKVDAGNGVADASDGAFTISALLKPSITLLYPNGGENLTIDSIVHVRWNAQDITGNIQIELSRDNGVTWSSIGTAPATAGTYDWTVTAPATTQALVRIGKLTLGIIDSSNAVFEISNKVVEPIVVVAPDGGEQLHMGETTPVKWTAPSSVTAVDIEYSSDGGGTWNLVITNIGSVGANPQYMWLVPQLSTPSANALVRVKDHSNAGLSDISNQPFSILNPIAGVEAPVAGTRGLSLLGNFPNPFAGVTDLRWRQAAGSDVEIRVYTQSGVMVSRYTAGHRESGDQHFLISGAELASGSYIYEVHAGAAVARGVMLLVR